MQAGIEFMYLIKSEHRKDDHCMMPSIYQTIVQPLLNNGWIRLDKTFYPTIVLPFTPSTLALRVGDCVAWFQWLS